MVIRRVKTQSSRLGVLNLDDYEFDSGFRGVCQRLHVSSHNAVIRLFQATRFFLTSFLGLHYIYIIMWSFVLSWILYPEKNMTYTDALFQGVSAMTLTGLNSVDINTLKLYQQIFLFISPILTHPLFVSTFMVFYRLYLYRKKFDDIENTSKTQSKLRRAATLSQYETTRKGGYAHNSGNHPMPQSIDLQLGRTGSSSREESRSSSHSNLSPYFQDGREHHMNNIDTVLQRYDDRARRRSVASAPEEFDEKAKKEDDSSSPTSSDTAATTANDELRPQRSQPQPSRHRHHASSDEEGGNDDDDDDDDDGEGGNKIRFGALPLPPSRGRQHDPQDMYRSLHMMRNQNLGDDLDEDDGPALVIKSPRDIEADERRGIHSSAVASSNAEPTSSAGEGNSFTSHRPGIRRLSTMSDLPPRAQRTLTRADTLMSQASNRSPKSMAANYLSWTPTVGRNSAFIGLTSEQKEELGGVEYRSLKLLRWISVAYFLIFLCLGWVFLIPWVYTQEKYRDLIRSHGVSPVNFAMTTTLSSFNNSGLCVLPSSLSEFWHTAYVPVIVSFIVMSGNVGIPIILRYSVYILFKLSPRFGQTRETLGFLLDHPRRSFMLLFPTTTTWWLLLTIFVFIITEVALFMILDSGHHSPQPDIHSGPRLLLAYFQSIAVRTVGFTMIDISSQAPGMLILNIVMMYIAIYPVAMSIRKTNVYEEQTLGHYYKVKDKKDNNNEDARSIESNAIDDDDDDDDDDDEAIDDGDGSSMRRARPSWSARKKFLKRIRRLSTKGFSGSSGQDDSAPNNEEEEDEDDEDEDDRPSTLVDHMRRQLSMDVWSLVIGLMLVCITEGGRITRGDFSMFGVVFEVVSAHGTIGWSMGLPGQSVSLSGGFSNLGKLVMMAIMIRGRHRAMPYNVDRAIILRGKDLIKRDREQENRARDARVLTHQEPGENSQWLPRVATTASKLTSFGTRRRPSILRQDSPQP